MGKWDKILTRLKLSKFVDGDEKYQTKVNVMKDRMRDDLGADFQVPRLASDYAELRREKAILKEQESELNLKIAAMEQLLDERFKDEDVTNIRVAAGMVNVQREPHAKVEDKTKVRVWAIENGLEEMLAIPWQTLNSHTKELLQGGYEPPPGVSLWENVSIRFTPTKDLDA
jgi:hypothetical protein